MTLDDLTGDLGKTCRPRADQIRSPRLARSRGDVDDWLWIALAQKLARLGPKPGLLQKGVGHPASSGSQRRVKAPVGS